MCARQRAAPAVVSRSGTPPWVVQSARAPKWCVGQVLVRCLRSSKWAYAPCSMVCHVKFAIKSIAAPVRMTTIVARQVLGDTGRR